mgnify:CR=1 FL=1
MNVSQRDVWWADIDEPIGSAAGFTRPVVIIQGDALNASRMTTYLSIPLSTNLQRANLATNLLLRAADTGLPRDSVAQVGLLYVVDASQLIEHAGQISSRELERLFAKLDLALGR